MYILHCNDGTFYTGSTIDLTLRFIQYQSGFGANYTKRRLPVTLVYWEEYDRITDAFNREKQVQNWSHQKKLVLTEGESGLLSGLARKVFTVSK
ncbi:MAG: GIY-YIG nuclease family protein [Bacteroidetes bacterium]|nr:GIY-YIG nuclease family protein [Bacteroidota bacterium]